MFRQRTIQSRENRMRMEALKMQTNCVGISARERSAETPRRSAHKNVAKSGLGQRLHPQPRRPLVQPRQPRRCNGRGQHRNQQRRSQRPRRVIHRLVLRPQIERPAAHPPHKRMKPPSRARLLRLDAEEYSRQPHHLPRRKGHRWMNRGHLRPRASCRRQRIHRQRSARMHHHLPR